MNYENPVASMQNDPVKLFSALREKAISSNAGASFQAGNILKLQKGRTYSFRLLWLPSKKRMSPMINQYVHKIWSDTANGRRSAEVICPTSEYDKNREGFNDCPICETISKYYKDSQNGSESAGELYRKFRRTLSGYVPVYVINGPDEDKHKVKLLHYPIQFKKYFDAKIFGLKGTQRAASNGEVLEEEIDESNVVGIDAFMYYDPNKEEVVTSGYNFIVQVNTQKMVINGKSVEMPEYKLDFSMKKTDILDFDGNEITPEYFNSLNDELQFDAKFYVKSDSEELANFKKRYIDGNDAEDEIDVEEAEEKPAPKQKIVKNEDYEDDEDEKPVVKAKAKAKVRVEEEDEAEEEEEEAAPKVEKKPAKKVVVEEDESGKKASSDDDDDIDLDELLKDI